MKRMFLLVLFACNIGVASPVGESTDVSLLQLISNPEKYNDKPIRLIAFLHLEFEGDALYLHREDFENRILVNAISIDVPKYYAIKTKAVNDQYVLVEGIFSSKEKGHLGIFAGSLRNVKTISPMPKPRK